MVAYSDITTSASCIGKQAQKRSVQPRTQQAAGQPALTQLTSGAGRVYQYPAPAGTVLITQ